MSTDQDWSQYEPQEGRRVTTSLPCPSWCVLDTGHPFETTTIDANPLRSGVSLFRVHRRRFGERPTHVSVETYERTIDATGPSDLGSDPAATVVRLQLPDAHCHLSPEGARRLADLLTEAAALASGARG